MLLFGQRAAFRVTGSAVSKSPKLSHERLAVAIEPACHRPILPSRHQTREGEFEDRRWIADNLPLIGRQTLRAGQAGG
jgi:hypothetical protein